MFNLNLVTKPIRMCHKIWSKYIGVANDGLLFHRPHKKSLTSNFLGLPGGRFFLATLSFSKVVKRNGDFTFAPSH